MRYYDTITGTLRIKRRYVWAFLAGAIFFAAGIAIGALMVR
jgi:hypothetical protein